MPNASGNGTITYGACRARVSATPNLPTNIVDFRGFDSSRILNLRGEIPRPIGDSPESLSQAMSVGVMLVGRLGVPSRLQPLVSLSPPLSLSCLSSSLPLLVSASLLHCISASPSPSLSLPRTLTKQDIRRLKQTATIPTWVVRMSGACVWRGPCHSPERGSIDTLVRVDI